MVELASCLITEAESGRARREEILGTPPRQAPTSAKRGTPRFSHQLVNEETKGENLWCTRDASFNELVNF